MTHSLRVLVVADGMSLGEQAGRLLSAHFDDIVYSTDPQQYVADFDRHRAPLCVLAFDRLVTAEQYLVELERSSESLHAFAQRRLALCHHAEVQRGYDLCLRGHFDDYVAFGPAAVDTHRLLLAAHRAAGELQALALRSERLGEWVVEAHRLEHLEDRLSASGAWLLEQIDSALGSLQGVSGAPGGGRTLELDAARAKLGWIRHWALNLNHEWNAELATTQRLRALAGRARPVILAVDDDELQHTLLRRLLGDEALEVLSAHTVSEAMSILQVRKIDCILMDIGLPDLDGIEAIKMIKSSGANASIAVIVLTGSQDTSDLQRSLDAGAIGFVPKPLNRPMLLSRLRSALPGH